jgi:hypothetical protein
VDERRLGMARDGASEARKERYLAGVGEEKGEGEKEQLFYSFPNCSKV